MFTDQPTFFKVLTAIIKFKTSLRMNAALNSEIGSSVLLNGKLQPMPSTNFCIITHHLSADIGKTLWLDYILGFNSFISEHGSFSIQRFVYDKNSWSLWPLSLPLPFEATGIEPFNHLIARQMCYHKSTAMAHICFLCEALGS